MRGVGGGWGGGGGGGGGIIGGYIRPIKAVILEKQVLIFLQIFS